MDVLQALSRLFFNVHFQFLIYEVVYMDQEITLVLVTNLFSPKVKGYFVLVVVICCTVLYSVTMSSAVLCLLKCALL